MIYSQTLDLPYGEANPADVLDAVSEALRGRGAEVRRVDRNTVAFDGPRIGADPAPVTSRSGTDFAWLVSGGSVRIEPLGPVESVRLELRFSPIVMLLGIAVVVVPILMVGLPTTGSKVKWIAIGLAGMAALFFLAARVMTSVVVSGLQEAY